MDRNLSPAFRPLWNELIPHRPPSRLLWFVALAWLASAVFHLGVFVLDDTAWSGSVSWRKPIVFSASIGLLLWAYGWVLDRLPHRPKLAWALATAFAASSTLETALIALQQWRGRASHFNVFQAGDAAIFAIMGAVVGVMSVLLLGLFVWSLIERPADRLERLAVIGGLALVMTGLGIGQWIISLGVAYVERFDAVPETVISGEAGVAKFPHAVSFHGIQVFMVAAAMLRNSDATRHAAQRLLGVIVAAYTGILVFAALQSFGGRAPLDLDIISGGLLVVSVLVAGIAGVVAIRWWWATPRPELRVANAGSERRLEGTFTR